MGKTLLTEDLIHNFFPGNHSTQGIISGCHPLGEHNDIGNDVPVLVGEKSARPTEPRHHFI